MAAQGAFGIDFYDRSILRPKHRAYRSGRPVIEIGPKGALGSHEIRPIHSALSLGQSIVTDWSKNSRKIALIAYNILNYLSVLNILHLFERNLSLGLQ